MYEYFVKEVKNVVDGDTIDFSNSTCEEQIEHL